VIREISEAYKKYIETYISLIQDESIRKKIRAEGHEKRFDHKGYPCAIVRCGVHLCGYVGLPEGHKYYGKGCGQIDVDVHGGITYAKKDSGFWVIGFDCAHPGDYTAGSSDDETYRDIEYVEGQLKKLVEQIA
jgi:hypothetical protein